MDISDIGEVASRKKINENAGKIRDKVNRENAKIIKMKVAQDTSYWDLKEKLSQIEGNYERLQQNMVELQMQYETVSMKYQDELRLRMETLNKVASMKALADVMEDYVSKVSDTLSRTRSDCNTLANAYTRASSTVSDLYEQYSQLQRTKTDESRDFSRFMEELAVKSKNETCAAINHVADVLRNQHTQIIQKNEELISSLQSEVKQLTEDLNEEKCRLQGVIATYEIKAAEEARNADEIRVKLSSTEECVNMLREQLAAAERERNLLQQVIDTNNSDLQESAATVERLNNSLFEIKEENLKFAGMVTEKNQVIGERQDYITKLNNELATVSMKYAETAATLTTVKTEQQAEATKIKQMTEEMCVLRKQLGDTEAEFKKQQAENDSKAANARNIISGLMSDVQAATQVEDNLKKEIHALKANAAADQDALRQEEGRQRSRADNLELNIKNKDKEITELKTIVQEKDREITWLKDKIRAMQNTIDNIQKELTSRLQAGVSERSEQPERPEGPERDHYQHKVTKRDDFDIYNFLSNSSDSDAISTGVVKSQLEGLAKRARANATEVKTGGGAGTGTGAASDNAENKIANTLGMILGTAPRNTRLGQSPISLSISQVKNDLNTKKRMFFKSKNSAPKVKKIK